MKIAIEKYYRGVPYYAEAHVVFDGDKLESFDDLLIIIETKHDCRVDVTDHLTDDIQEALIEYILDKAESINKENYELT